MNWLTRLFIRRRPEALQVARSWRGLEGLSGDLRFAARTLGKNPGFATIAIFTLALGIGANTAIFSVVNAALLRSLPFRQASRIVDISARSTLFDFSNLGVSLPDIADIQSTAQSFDALAPYQTSYKELAGYGKPERIESAEVSANFLPVLGIQLLYGRAFTSSDMEPGNRAIIIGHSLWRERFGGDPEAVGKTLMVDGQLRTIVGVLPALQQLGFATDCQLWTPFIPSEEDLTKRDNHSFSVIATLKPGTSLEKAQKELDVISSRLAAAYPDADKGWSLHATPLKRLLVGDANTPLAILFCAVGFILLIACANVSNLFLSRGWARRREFAVRAAIGASRGALLRQVGTECVLVALAGGSCAFLVAMWAVQALRAVLPPEIPRIQNLRVDSEVGWFTLGVSLLAALLSGIAPAILISHQDVNVAIKEAHLGMQTKRRHNFFRQSLVVAEIALASILLIGATLAVQSFAKILQVNPGFRPDHLLTMRMDFPQFRFATTDQAIAFIQQVLEGTRATPGIESASASLVYPLGDEVAETTFETQETAKDPRAGQQSALGNRVAPGFFRTFGIPLLAGRDFGSRDVKDSSPAFIVNETLARKFFGSTDVVGRLISTRRESGHPVWGEIVGVCGNVRQLDPGAEPKAEVYAPFYQTRLATGAYLVARTGPDPMALVPAIEDRIWAVDKNQPITDIKTANSRISEVNATPRSQSVLLGTFGALGVLLALIGVYGVMSYFVSQQTREIGIRMALGADASGILHLVLAHGLRLTVTGLMIGVTGALTLTRFMRSLLFGISATDPATFIAVTVLLTMVAVGACYIPARRAMRLDPMVALRYE